MCMYTDLVTSSRPPLLVGCLVVSRAPSVLWRHVHVSWYGERERELEEEEKGGILKAPHYAALVAEKEREKGRRPGVAR